jgi:NAD(P)-dependent dehydrogenase (short-subunit alcohol dehydrogenase family)
MKTVPELLRLDGRTAVVTGGAGHLGLAIAEALAEAGAQVVLVDRDQAVCDAQADLLRRTKGMGAVALALAVDLGDPQAASTIVARTLESVGRLDILVNNAAFTGDSRLAGWAVPFPQQSLEAWDAAVRTNLTAPFLLVREAQEALAASGRGSIINVASIYGELGPDFSLYEGTAMANPAAYGASKGGLIQLTRHLATVLAPRIRVNAISPGGVERGQPAQFQERYRARTPLGRMATEEDVKGAVAFLASDAAAYITGQNLMIDGGWSVW